MHRIALLLLFAASTASAETVTWFGTGTINRDAHASGDPALRVGFEPGAHVTFQIQIDTATPDSFWADDGIPAIEVGGYYGAVTGGRFAYEGHEWVFGDTYASWSYVVVSDRPGVGDSFRTYQTDYTGSIQNGEHFELWLNWFGEEGMLGSDALLHSPVPLAAADFRPGSFQYVRYQYDEEMILSSFGQELVTFDIDSISSEPPAPVPLPAAAWLMMSALGALGLAMRRRGERKS